MIVWPTYDLSLFRLTTGHLPPCRAQHTSQFWRLDSTGKSLDQTSKPSECKYAPHLSYLQDPSEIDDVRGEGIGATAIMRDRPGG